MGNFDVFAVAGHHSYRMNSFFDYRGIVGKGRVVGLAITFFYIRLLFNVVNYFDGMREILSVHMPLDY